MNLILFGFKGAGKTYLGSRLGLPFLDTDSLFPQPPHLLYPQIGEVAFRALERSLISSLSLSVTDAVIALGAGAILHCPPPPGRLVYLDAPLPLILSRVAHAPYPIAATYAFRKPLYDAIPAHRLDATLPESILLTQLKALYYGQ